MELKKYADIAYDQFGGLALELVPHFQDFNMTLNKANIKLSLPEYIALSIGFVVTSTVFIFTLFGTLFVLSSGLSGLLTAFIIALFVAMFATGLTYLFPVLKVSNRASVIRDMLPFAVMYLSTLAGTGSSIAEMFENLSKVDEYGEVSEEAAKIHRDIDTFGMDVNEALIRGAERTPSEDFEELLRGMDHILTTGGSVREFLKERSAKLMDDYERRIEKFSDQLGLLVEMYITIVVVGSIIFTAMSAVMSSFTGFAPGFIVALQAVLIFIIFPLISGMFIIFIKGIAPGGIMS